MGLWDSGSVLVIHIGPVQEFIRTARRSRDLWFGSWLLSELAKAAAEKIVEINRGDLASLVFPAPDSLEELRSEEFNSANKVIAFTLEDPAKVADAAREAVRGRLRFLRDEAYGRVKGSFAREVAIEQVEDLLEYYWAAAPVKECGYDRARRLAEAALAARKSTRDFGPVTWGSDAPKCSLDGVRESVIPRQAYKDTEKEKGERFLYYLYGVSRGEHLCGVCLMKRHGARGKQERFLSTSHVAALPLLERLTPDHVRFIEEYLGKLERLGIPEDELRTVSPAHPIFGSTDGELLFEDRLHEFFPERDRWEESKRALKEFLAKACGDLKPIPYYALLMADGDWMGKAIDAQKTAEAHRKISNQQSRFARQAREIVRSRAGSPIYSGGDDVLALVPLHTVMDCARSLADEFREMLREFKVPGEGGSVSPTLSVGIAVAHHLAPLSEVIQMAEHAKNAAKSLAGKNALGITLSKRAGSEATVAGKWGEIDRRLMMFVRLLLEEALPEGVGFELVSLADELEGTSDVTDTLRRVLTSEVGRILQRKRQRKGREPVSEDTVKALMDEVRAVLERGDPCAAIRQFAQEIVVARELARACRIAGKAVPQWAGR